jgi:hypothetical protein
MAGHYANDAEAGQAPKADPKMLAKLRFAHTSPKIGIAQGCCIVLPNGTFSERR